MSVDGVGAYIFINMDQKQENSGLKGKEVYVLWAVLPLGCAQPVPESMADPSQEGGLASSVLFA